MGCNSCAYLKMNDKKDGKTNGAVYYCSKRKCYVNGASNACSDYSFDYSRKTYLKDEIFHDGEKYCDDNFSIAGGLFIIIFLIIFGLILGVFNI